MEQGLIIDIFFFKADYTGVPSDPEIFQKVIEFNIYGQGNQRISQAVSECLGILQMWSLDRNNVYFNAFNN